jgi:hypothetical protein
MSQASAAIAAFTSGAAEIGEREAALNGHAGVVELLRYQDAWTHCSDEQKAIIRSLFVGWHVWPSGVVPEADSLLRSERPSDSLVLVPRTLR